MERREFEAKLKQLPVEEPDEIDCAMLAEAEEMDDGTTITLEELKRNLEGYSGKLVLRIPRSLHRELKEAAEIEGVSLNQYMLYKLAGRRGQFFAAVQPLSYRRGPYSKRGSGKIHLHRFATYSSRVSPLL